MGSEIELGFGLAKLKVSLNDLVLVVKGLSGEAHHQEVRKAIKDLIIAARTSYDTTRDALTPFYSLDTGKRFDTSFAELRMRFKTQYLTNSGSVRTHCRIVEQKLRELRNKQGLMRAVPIVKRSFERLDGLAAGWLARDDQLAEDMDGFLRNMNELLDAVDRTRTTDPEEAFASLRESLSLLEDNFLGTKEALDELDVVSSRL